MKNQGWGLRVQGWGRKIVGTLALLTIVVAAAGQARGLNKKLLLKRLAVHGAAAFDGWTTYRLAHMPGRDILWREPNPWMRPVANGPWVFVGTQIDTLPWELLRKRLKHRWQRTVLNVFTGYSTEEHLRLGINNLRLYNRQMKARDAACATAALGGIPGPDWQCGGMARGSAQ